MRWRRAWACGLVAPDDGLVRSALAWTLRLDRGAAYDGFRSALAEGLGCDLWTADRRLARAVDVGWVRVAGAVGQTTFGSRGGAAHFSPYGMLRDP